MLSTGTTLGDALYSHEPPPHEILPLISPEITILHPRSNVNSNSSSIAPNTSHSNNYPHRTSPFTPSSTPPALFLHASHISMHRYRDAGYPCRFRLGLTTPLPCYFVEVCHAAGLSRFLRPMDLQGGPNVDGVLVDMDKVEKGMIGWKGRSHAVDGKRLREQRENVVFLGKARWSRGSSGGGGRAMVWWGCFGH